MNNEKGNSKRKKKAKCQGKMVQTSGKYGNAELYLALQTATND